MKSNADYFKSHAFFLVWSSFAFQWEGSKLITRSNVFKWLLYSLLYYQVRGYFMLRARSRVNWCLEAANTDNVFECLVVNYSSTGMLLVLRHAVRILCTLMAFKAKQHGSERIQNKHLGSTSTGLGTSSVHHTRQHADNYTVWTQIAHLVQTHNYFEARWPRPFRLGI